MLGRRWLGRRWLGVRRIGAHGIGRHGVGGRWIGRVVRATGQTDYAVAIALAAAAVGLRLVVNAVAAGVAPFEALFPAIALAGVFCGTRPAVLAAGLGWLAIGWLCFGAQLLAGLPLNSAQIDMLLFVPAAGTIIAATSALRRFAAGAVAAEARLAEVVRQVPGAAAIISAPDGRLLLRSANSDAVLGRREQLMRRAEDMAWYGGRHPDWRPYAPGDYPIVRALQTGEVVRGERMHYHRPDGSEVDLEVHAGPVRDLDGGIIAAVGMAFDMTDRVEAERRLLASEVQHRTLAERLRAAIDAGALGTWEFDLATQRLDLDGAFAAMLGLPPTTGQLTRSAFRALVHPPDQVQAAAAFDASLRHGAGYGDEFRIRRPDGQVCWLLLRGTCLADLHKVVGVASDVTERRAREDAIQAALEAREVLMYEADHRIKNSLQLVVSLLSLQQSKAAHPDVRMALADAVARVDAVARSHQAMQSSPNLRSVAIGQMLEELCERIGALNPAVRVRCSARVAQLLDVERAIPLSLIASELLTNALRHGFPHGTSGEVSLSAAECGDELSVVVADTGTGLPAAPARRGLGSTIIAMLARQIGAEIDSRSVPGAGVTVTVRLKRNETAAAAELAAAVSR